MDFVARDNTDHVWRNDRGLDLGDWLSVDARMPSCWHRRRWRAYSIRYPAVR